MMMKVYAPALATLAIILLPALTMGSPSPNLKGPASAQVTKGGELYKEFCALCHGDDGKRGQGFQTPIWGDGSLIATKFGNIQGLIDYMQLMPFNDPTLLDDAQKLAVVAYMMSNHGAIPATESLDPAKAASIPIR